ncbi:MAG TPA: serine/threonine-protein kinase [Nannocystaceae bacterium]|nr:serine/threonine-protein kinase [Nannocystaceae bacterium]
MSEPQSSSRLPEGSDATAAGSPGRPDAEADTIIEGQRGTSTVESSDHGLTPGTRLGRYVVLEEIGQGGMGLVFSAYDPELNRKVALKLLRPNQSERKRARSRLLQEAQALAKLAHPNVITVYDVGTIGERVFVAMELIEGTTIKGWLAEKPRRWDEVLEVFIPAGRGLAAAHAANLVHRDFKPDNVLIGRDGRVRVMDFGLARPVNSEIGGVSDDDNEELDDDAPQGDGSEALDEPLLTQTGSIMGTPAYMAPEQHLGKPTDARSDQFSFCTALYQALYGERPFDGDDAGTLTQQKLQGKIREPGGAASVPGWVRRSLLRGLAADPQERFASMEALLTELGKDPRVLRRKIATGVGLGAAMTATVWGVYLFRNRPDPVCLESGDKLAAVWNEDRKATVQAGLSAVDRDFVPQTVELVGATLDEYAASWTQMHTEACEATYVRGEQSQRLLERRNLCLQDRLSELDALAKILASADPVVAAQAGFAALELQPLSQCADTETLNAEVEPPQDNATRDAVAELRHELMRVKALASAGLIKEALDAAQAAYVRAQTIATPDGETYQPIVAEARFRLGDAQAVADEPESAEKNLSEASWLGASVKHDVVAAAAAGALVPVVGQGLRRPDEGLSWGRHAEAALKRIGMAGRAEARLRHDVGVVLGTIGEDRRAGDSLQTALGLLGKEPASQWWIAAVHRALGDLSLHEGRTADARADFDRAAETFVAAFGDRHPDNALVIAGHARVLAAEGDIAGARTKLKEAAALVEGALGPGATRLLPLCRQLAKLELSQKNWDAAIAELERAQRISRDAWGDHPKVAQALFELGNALSQAGKLDLARAQHDRALSLWERTRGKDHPDVAFALTSLGQIDLQQGRANEAVERLERALKLRGGRGLDPQLLAQTQFALARALHAVDDRPRARELAAKARDAFKTGKPPSPDRAAEIDTWLASVGETLPERPGPI